VLGFVFIILGAAAPEIWNALPGWARPTAIGVAIVLWGFAIFLACSQSSTEKIAGGRGGSAVAAGDESNATGGRGGEAGKGNGGDGGAATAKGRGSVAIGGDGGRG